MTMWLKIHLEHEPTGSHVTALVDASLPPAAMETVVQKMSLDAYRSMVKFIHNEPELGAHAVRRDGDGGGGTIMAIDRKSPMRVQFHDVREWLPWSDYRRSP